MQNWEKGCVFCHIDKFWNGHDRQIFKNACKNVYLGSIFIPEKYVINRVLFVSPWTSLIPPLAIRVPPPPPEISLLQTLLGQVCYILEQGVLFSIASLHPSVLFDFLGDLEDKSQSKSAEGTWKHQLQTQWAINYSYNSYSVCSRTYCQCTLIKFGQTLYKC